MINLISLCKFCALTTDKKYTLELLPDCGIYIISSGNDVYFYDQVSAFEALDEFSKIAAANLTRRAAEKLLREGRNYITNEIAATESEKKVIETMLYPYMHPNVERIGDIGDILNGGCTI